MPSRKDRDVVAFMALCWWVMEAPTGQRFCVVRAQPEPGEDAARRD